MRRIALCIGIGIALLLAIETSTSAQVQMIEVSKQIQNLQTSAGTARPRNVVTPCFGCPYDFLADVRGNNIGGMTPPTVSGPISTASLGAFYNNGKLVYDASTSQWRFGAPGNDWSSPTLADLESIYGNGTYTFVVNGQAITLNLSGATYPNTPIVTFSSGRWKDGVLEFDPSQPLTITTNAFSGYGSGVDGVIDLGIDDGPGITQARVIPPISPGTITASSANTASLTIPANTYTNGQQASGSLNFVTVTDLSTTSGSLNIATYRAETDFQIKAVSPVFPMTVNANIGPVTSNASAQVQYRPQDVGSTGSLYVFAVAPATIVKDAVLVKGAELGIAARGTAKDTPVSCVLAQLTNSGQLQAVSASSLQAYVTGVLSAQGQAVTILNATPTPNVQGATFYVGYGSDPSSMISSGINERAVSVPGDVQCDPQPPQTGWWWNPQEDGRGYSMEVQGNHYFFAAFLYDASGRATWYVSTGGASLDGSLIKGTLLSASGGQTLGGSYPGFPAIKQEGPITLAFNDASHGTLVWPGGTVPIQRFNIVTNGLTLAPQTNQPETGWWWNANESGRGFFLEWQGGVLDIAGYMYDAQGNPIWYLTENSPPSANLGQFSSNWWQFANGMTLAGPWKQNQLVNDHVAPVTIQFQDSQNAIMTLPNGRTTRLTRQAF